MAGPNVPVYWDENQFKKVVDETKLPLTGGNITGSLTVASKNVVTEGYACYPIISKLTAPSGALLYNGQQIADPNALSKSGGTMTGRLDLCGSGFTKALSFYNSAYYTWIEYMSPAGAGTASTGAAGSTYGDVTSWARRSTIESSAGYGWMWDSCANAVNAVPDPKMSLSSSNGNLKVKGTITGTKVYGAVYNDYAEYRNARNDFRPGTVVTEDESGFLKQSNNRLTKIPMVVSDTYGFSIGDTKAEGGYALPIAVSGRVLAYTDKDKSTFKLGDAVCAGINGTVSKMAWWEKIIFPDRILGLVSEVPKYDSWGSDEIKVNNRIWIKI